MALTDEHSIEAHIDSQAGLAAQDAEDLVGRAGADATAARRLAAGIAEQSERDAQ